MSRHARPPPVILALSGGTGGSKMVDGLAQVAGQEALAAVVNTGDDADFYGLRVCPDLDICTYMLAGVVAERGWGYAGDSFRCLEGLATYGREAWFGLGDRDLATHLHRTLRLAEGAAPERGDRGALRARWGWRRACCPMTDDPVRTRITTPAGRAQLPGVPGQARRRPSRSSASTSSGIAAARPAPGVLEAIAAAERIVIVPSSPVVSIGTILAVPGVRAALRARRADCVAVSPIIGGRPVEGPADRFLRRRRLPASARPARWPASTPTWPAPSCWTAATPTLAPAVAALGVRPVLRGRPDARPRRRAPAWPRRRWTALAAA